MTVRSSDSELLASAPGVKSDQNRKGSKEVGVSRSPQDKWTTAGVMPQLRMDEMLLEHVLQFFLLNQLKCVCVKDQCVCVWWGGGVNLRESV